MLIGCDMGMRSLMKRWGATGVDKPKMPGDETLLPDPLGYLNDWLSNVANFSYDGPHLVHSYPTLL